MDYNLINRMYGSNGIRQGIPRPKISQTPNNNDEYETYVDPNCGCTKTRKKIKKEEIGNTEVKSSKELKLVINEETNTWFTFDEERKDYVDTLIPIN